MKKVYNYDLCCSSTIFADDTEAICVVDDRGEARFYFTVFNPQFKNHDSEKWFYAYVFEELTELIDYIGQNAMSEVYSEGRYDFTAFETKEDYLRWFNSLEW